MNGSVCSRPCLSSVARISCFVRTSTQSPARRSMLSAILDHSRLFGELLQPHFTKMHSAWRLHACNIENALPAIYPIVEQESALGVAAADFLHSLRLRCQRGQYLSRIRAIWPGVNNCVGPVEHCPKRFTVGRLSDHDGPGCGAFIVPEAYLDLTVHILRHVHFAWSDDEETASLRHVRVQIAMLFVIRRLTLTRLKRVVDVERSCIRRPLQQCVVQSIPSASNAVSVDYSGGQSWVGAETDRIDPARHVMARSFDCLAQPRDGSIHTDDNVIESGQRGHPILVQRQIGRPQLVDPADACPAVILPIVDRVHVEKVPVGLAHYDEDVVSRR